MSYHIKIRSRSDPVVMSDTAGKEFSDAFLAGTLPERVEVARGLSVLSSHIDSVEYIAPPRDIPNDARDLTPEERATNLKRLAKMKEALWGKMTQKDTGHYTEAHRLIKCTCFSPDQWPKD